MHLLQRLAPLAILSFASATLATTARAQTTSAQPTSQPTSARWEPGPDARVRYTINDGWRFLPDGVEFAEKALVSDAGWQQVNVPHTWNAHDPFDDVDSYRRGTSWYRRRLPLPDSLRGRRVQLHFEGVNQTADVYVNGAYVGSHAGGYTAFSVDFTQRARFGPDSVNLIAVKVDNSHDPMIAPLSVGFALYGGIYRDVWLVATDPVHVATDDHASSGVYLTTPAVSRERADVRVRGTLVNDGPAARQLRVVTTVTDAEGVRVGVRETAARVAPDARAPFTHTLPTMTRPRLWSPDEPYLYTVYTDVYDGDRLVDRVTNPLGLRWFRFDPDSGFFLNGARLGLRGTNRHQDYAGLGSALSNRLHVRDLEIVKEMGANFLRLAHYPQDPAVLEAADRLGLLIWEEIPLVNYATRAPAFVANAHQQLREMIRQHHNHPSVVMWGIMNEIFLWSETAERVGTVPDTSYTRWVRDLARGLDILSRREDPARFTAMAIHGSTQYERTEVGNVTQVVGVNLYNGWYGGTVNEFGRHLDRVHKLHPDQSLFVSEYGSGSDLRLNSTQPERFDHSSIYHAFFHESYLRQSRERPYLGGTAIWNQFDFSQPHIGESISNMNQKGMLTFDRRPKDVFYMYKANWNPAPMVHIASRDWAHRAGIAGVASAPVAETASAPFSDAPGTTQPVDVYTNMASVELFVNGRSLGTQTPNDVRRARFMVPFAAGENVLEARGTGGQATTEASTDRMTVRFDVVPADLRTAPFTELAVNVGARAQYEDADGLVWLPDQPYRTGSYGHVGGKPVMFNRSFAITHTNRVGMYFTLQQGLTGYRMDVPDGEYEVELHMVEPADVAAGARVFQVAANGRTVLDRVDLAERAGFRRAAPVAFRTRVVGGQGLQLDFRSIAGEPVLSGIRVVKR